MPKKDTIYLVPHTHYDAVWVLSKEDYFYINIDLILKQAVELIENSNYKFLIEQTFLLEEVEKRNPRLFKKIKKFIQEGKMEIADGEYLMADTMLPAGETLVREILWGKLYAKKKFGVDVPVMWQADSFGLNAQLPQIYKKSGYKYIAFRRGANKKKPSEFLWQGLDGTKILAHWMPKGYRAGLDFTELNESYKELKKLSATSHILMPSGSGITIPQPETNDVVKKWNRKHKNVKMKISKPSDFFEAIEEEVKDLEVREGEMYSGKFSEVFPNNCSSRMWVKQKMRESENLLQSAERWSTLHWLLSGQHPSFELKDCWRKILFAAFHDIVPGTGIDDCFKEIEKNFDYFEIHSSELLNKSLSEIAEKVKSEGEIIVFNLLSWKVKNWTEIELNFAQGKIKKIEGLKHGKEEIEAEIVEFSRHEDDSLKTAKIGFVAEVPALGYKTYKILQREPRAKSPSYIIEIKGNTIKNSFFKIKINPENGLIDVYQNRKRIVSGNELVLDEEIGDLYYHRSNLKIPLKTESGGGIKYGAFKIEGFEIKKSSLRRIINLRGDCFSLRWPYRLLKKMKKPLLWRHKYLSFVKKIIIYKDLPRIDFITEVNNHHPQIRIRLKFSTDIESSNYTSETQFGAIKRPTNQYHFEKKQNWLEKPCGVYPALNWLDYSDKERGVTIINRGIPAHEIRDGNIYLTLLRGVSILSSDGMNGPAIPTPDAAELKLYTYYYSLLPHQKTWKEATSYNPAYEFNYPLTAFHLENHNRTEKDELPPQFSFIEIKPKNLILSALKKVETEKNEVVIRFFETKGEKTQAEINLFKKPISVKRANLLEEGEKEINFENKKIQLEVKPFEIVTLKIEF